MAADKPNVLLIMGDQHRWDFLGTETNGTTFTPHLDALAARGTRFRAAYCTAPLCSPSREAIASGRYGMNSGCFTNLHELPPGSHTFTRQFRSAGYRTCAVGKTHMEIHAYDSDLCSDAHRAFMDSLGWDQVCEISGNGMLKTGIRCAYSEFLRQRGRFAEVLEYYRGWRYFMDTGRQGDPDFVCHPWPFEEELHETAFVTESALDWLRTRADDRPFLLHVGYAAPHSPTEPLPRFLELYQDVPEPEPAANPQPPPWLADARRGYRAMISEIDEGVGRILAHLRETGQLANTIVLYTADHGEMAGDNGRFGKTCFFEGSVRVPLIVAGPGVVAGRTSGALAELLDIGRTLCELCGVPAHDLDQGRSLAPLLSAEVDAHRDTVYAEMGCDRMLFDGRWKLMYGDPAADTRRLGRLHLDKPVTVPASPCRLFDLHADPWEEQDLADAPEHQQQLLLMTRKLLARINENLQPQPMKSRGEYRPLV